MTIIAWVVRCGREYLTADNNWTVDHRKARRFATKPPTDIGVAEKHMWL